MVESLFVLGNPNIIIPHSLSSRHDHRRQSHIPLSRVRSAGWEEASCSTMHWALLSKDFKKLSTRKSKIKKIQTKRFSLNNAMPNDYDTSLGVSSNRNGKHHLY